MRAAKDAASADERCVHVVLPASGDRFELDVKAMQRVLLDPRVRDRHVVVLSIAGVQRLGKSLILNYVLRYLKSEVGRPIHLHMRAVGQFVAPFRCVFAAISQSLTTVHFIVRPKYDQGAGQLTLGRTYE